MYVNQQAYPNSPVTNTDPSYNSETKIDKQIAVEGLVIALHIYHTEYDTTACKLAPQIGRRFTTQQLKCSSQHRRLNTCSPNLDTAERHHCPSFDYFKPLRSQEPNKNSKEERRRKRSRLFYETTRRPHCDRLIHACHRNLGNVQPTIK